MAKAHKNGWKTHEEFVLSSLTRLEGDIKEIGKNVTQQSIVIQELKTKIAVWGSVMFAVASVGIPLVTAWLRT